MEEKIDNNMYCMSCLCLGRSLHYITDEKLQRFYLEAIKEIPLSTSPMTIPLLCWECQALLKKCVSFREQVKDSFRILQTYTSEDIKDHLLSEVSRPPHLEIRKHDAVSIEPWILVECDGEKQQGRHSVFVKDEQSETYEGYYTLSVSSLLFVILGNNVKEELQLEYNRNDDGVKDETNSVQDNLKIDLKTADSINTDVNEDALNSDVDCASMPRVSDVTDSDVELTSLVAHRKTKRKKKVHKNSVRKSRKKHTSTESHERENKGWSNNLDEQIDEFCTKTNVSQSHDKKPKRKKNNFSKIKNECSYKKTKQPTQNEKFRCIELTYEELARERTRSTGYRSADYKCDVCQCGFTSEYCYKQHNKNKHDPGIGDYVCPVCRTVLATMASFTSHYKRHTRRYECTACGERSTDKKTILTHYETAHVKRKEYECNLCDDTSASTVAQESGKDSQRSRVECSQCDKTFSHKAGLMTHTLVVHKLNNEFPCPECGKNFRWKTSLKKHMETHHRKQGKSPMSVAFCSPCGVSFTSVCSYKRHLKISLKHVTQEQLKFICDHCNKRYSNKTKLRDHIEEKHLHRTYQCHICLKPSKNRVCLDQHIRNVHKGRPNNKMCHHCGKGFPTKMQLESHIRSHTGERPYICEFCPTTFSQQSNLYKHNKQVHLNIKSKNLNKKNRIPNVEELQPAVIPPNISEDNYIKPVVVMHYSEKNVLM